MMSYLTPTLPDPVTAIVQPALSAVDLVKSLVSTVAADEAASFERLKALRDVRNDRPGSLAWSPSTQRSWQVSGWCSTPWRPSPQHSTANTVAFATWTATSAPTQPRATGLPNSDGR